uniref:Uncharacterized protein n=1 Tax=Knipowitschia caucasica TaxID=637954 RepID=A0AAV2LX65_KNICA
MKEESEEEEEEEEEEEGRAERVSQQHQPAPPPAQRPLAPSKNPTQNLSRPARLNCTPELPLPPCCGDRQHN